MSDFKNYSQKPLSEINKNFTFLTDNTSVSKKALTIPLSFSVSLTEVSKQAKNFSLNYSTHGYLNLAKVLRIPSDKIPSKLENLYVYSFTKSVYNGIFFKNISEQSNLGLSFTGHASLFSILKSPNNTSYKDDFMLSFQINKGTENFQRALFLRLITKFPFLAAYKEMTSDSLGTFPFMIPEYETYFNRLNEDYYSRDHVSQREKSSEKAENSKSRALKDYSNGKLLVSQMDNNKQTSSILTFENSPILNAFTDVDNSKLYFIPVGNGKQVEFNPSFFFSKSNHIKVDTSKISSDVLNEYYKSVDITSKLSHLVCSEVHANTGIKCRTVMNADDDQKIIPSVSIIVDKIQNLIENSGSELGSFAEIIDDIIDKIIEGEEFMDELNNYLFPDSVK